VARENNVCRGKRCGAVVFCGHLGTQNARILELCASKSWKMLSFRYSVVGVRYSVVGILSNLSQVRRYKKLYFLTSIVN